MYQYDALDKEFLADRVGEFRNQVAQRLAGEITEDQFKPLRLMNGLYLQLHAYMLRIAIPYGTLNVAQLRRLAEIARKYDKGYTATSLRAPTCSSTGSSCCAMRRIFWRPWPRWTCTPSRPRATASAM